jgi:hypothetical protein
MRFKRLSLVCIAAATQALAMWACGGDDSDPGGTTDASVADGNVADVVTPVADGKAADDVATEAALRGGSVDRVGRAAIAEALVPGTDKDSYNRADPLALGGIGGITPTQVSYDFQASLVRLDRMDDVADWDGGSPDGSTMQVPVDAGPDADGGTTTVTIFTHPLVALLKTDVILVDSDKPFSPNGYLEIEYNAFVAGTPGAHSTCGGRWFADDAVDKTMSFIVKRNLSGVSDGVNQATKAPTMTFPFLPPPGP